MFDQNHIEKQFSWHTLSRSPRFWLGLSIGFSLLYGSLFWRIALSGEYAIQEDARQHIFWMQRFLDPSLFPQDLIADYFQSIAPKGYKFLYWGAAQGGISPILFSKIIPPFLGLICTLYGFYLGLAITQNSSMSFAFTLMFNQSLWMLPDIGSGTARAFAVPLLLAFLYYRTQSNPIAIVVVILLQGLFYPHLVFLSVGTLAFGLLTWKNGRLQWSNQKPDYLIFAAGTIVGMGVLLPFVWSTSVYSPVITAAEARVSAEFLPGGRHAFFVADPWVMWIAGRGGIFPTNFNPFFICVGFLFPLLMALKSKLKIAAIPPVPSFLERIREDNFIILIQFLASSLCFFGLSSAVLFKLHNPNRYTHTSIRIVLTLSAAIVIIGLLQFFKDWMRQRLSPGLGRSLIFGLVTTIVWGGLIFYPATLKSFLDVQYEKSNYRSLYEYLHQQPKDIKIASLAIEAGNIPTFAARTVLVSPEHSIAYHQGYYRQIKERVQDLMAAQYTESLPVLQAVIEKYHIDFWLIDQDSFDLEALRQNNWLQQFQPQTATIMEQLAQGQMPLLIQKRSRCQVLEEAEITLLNAQCLVTP